MQKTCLLTVDVEDWFQVENLRPAYPAALWSAQELRVERSVALLLELLSSRGIKATFFVLGWLAERLPDLVREIADQGHEIASHGYAHVLCPEMSADELLSDLKNSRALLEDITGRPVLGYRAPSFSVSDRVAGLLAASGYRYDSSFNSLTFNKRYGQIHLSGVQRRGLVYILESGLLEIPLSNLHLGPLCLPMAGGGYFRFWPSRVFNWGVKHILDRAPGYVFYCHPWEFDPDQPRVRDIGPLSYFRHYLGLKNNLDRLGNFLGFISEHVKFRTCAGYVQELNL